MLDALFLPVFPHALLFWWVRVAVEQLPFLALVLEGKDDALGAQGKYLGMCWHRAVTWDFCGESMLWELYSRTYSAIYSDLSRYLMSNPLDLDYLWECKPVVFRGNYGTCPSDCVLKRRCILIVSLQGFILLYKIMSSIYLNVLATRGTLRVFQNVLCFLGRICWKTKITGLDHCQSKHVCLLMVSLLIIEFFRGDICHWFLQNTWW